MLTGRAVHSWGRYRRRGIPKAPEDKGYWELWTKLLMFYIRYLFSELDFPISFAGREDQ